MTPEQLRALAEQAMLLSQIDAMGKKIHRLETCTRLAGCTKLNGKRGTLAMGIAGEYGALGLTRTAQLTE